MTGLVAILNGYPGTLSHIDEDFLVCRCLHCGPSAAHLARCAGAALNCADIAAAVTRVLSWPTPYAAKRPGRRLERSSRAAGRL
jgi:hypothetical protein